MAGRDVILTACACSAQAPCATWAKDLFREEPLVIQVPGTGLSLLKKGRQWSATGDAFRAALREVTPQYKDIDIRRRGVVTFSGGWQFLDHLLTPEREQELLDACIVEDGLHTRLLDHWVNFATRAANGEAWMVMAHSQVTSSYTSAKEANMLIFRRAVESNNADPVAPKTAIGALPDYLSDPELPEGGIRITVPAVKDSSGKVVMPAQTKLWKRDCLVSWENRGNLFRLEYEGADRPDHVYIAHHVSKRLWRFLADHWGA